MSDFGVSSPLSTIEEIQRRLVRPSQEGYFSRDLIKDHGNLKFLAKYDGVPRNLGEICKNVADKPCQDRECFVEPAKFDASSGDLVHLKSHKEESFLDRSQTGGQSRWCPKGNPEERPIFHDSDDLIVPIKEQSSNEHDFEEYSVDDGLNFDDLISDLKGNEDSKKCALIRPNRGHRHCDLDSHEASAETVGQTSEIANDDVILDAVLRRQDTRKFIKEATTTDPAANSSVPSSDLSLPPDLTVTANSSAIIHGSEHRKPKERTFQNIAEAIDYPNGKEEAPCQKSVKRSRCEDEGSSTLEDYLHPSLLSAASSKIRMKMKKVIFDWPSEELCALHGSRAQAIDDKDRPKLRRDSSPFRQFDEVVVKLFHSNSA